MGRHTADDAPQQQRHALDQLGVLDFAAESVFNDAVALAAALCDRPMAAITVIDKDRQWFLAEIGVGDRQVPSAWSFCRDAIARGSDGLEIADATLDPALCTNPLVTGQPGIRAYAGAPLAVDDGPPIGSLCVLDTEPGVLTDRQRFALRTLARQIALLLEGRRVTADVWSSVASRQLAATREAGVADNVAAMFNGLDASLVLTDDTGKVQVANQAFANVLGERVDNLAGTSYLDHLAADAQQSERQVLSDMWEQARPTAARELTFRMSDGDAVTLLATSFLARRPDGCSQSILTRFAGIEDQRQAEIEMHESQSAVDGLVTIGNDQRIISWNNGAARVLGHERADAIGKHVSFIIPPNMREAHKRLVARVDVGLETTLLGKTVEIDALHRDGSVVPVELSVSRWFRGDEPFYTAVIRDISERRRHEAEQLWHSTHDATTGLGNLAGLRGWFEENCVGEMRRGPSGFPLDCAVFSLQLTSLDTVTAALGVEVAEHLLACVGRAFAEANRHDLTICHLGDSHFAGAALIDSDDDSPATLEERLDVVARYVLAAAAGPFTAGGLPIEMQAQIGLAARASADTTFTELLRQAEATRTLTPRRINIAHRRGTATSKGALDMRLISEFRTAVETGQLEMHYQPLTRLQGPVRLPASGAGSEPAPPQGMVEALVRWRHPDRGIVAPGAFIPLIESGPLITVLTKWALDTALRQQADWRDQGLDIMVAVNLSPHVLLNDDVVTLVNKALSNAGAEPTRLKIEITESAIIVDPDETRNIVTSLRGLGVAVSLDDFGTGFTSLSLLRDLPVDEIKLDRLFVAGATTNPADAAVASAVALLAQRLGIRTVAEGIEDLETRSLFRDLGYDHMQGFLDSPPLPAERVTRWLRQHPETFELDASDRMAG